MTTITRDVIRDLRLPPTPGPAPTAEKMALDATRRLMKTRTSTLVVAIVFTLLPFSFLFEGTRITFLVIRDEPVVGWTWLGDGGGDVGVARCHSPQAAGLRAVAVLGASLLPRITPPERPVAPARTRRPSP